MAEIGFYHLTRTTTEQALPALLARTLAAGERAVVLCADDARADALSKTLWALKEPDWLPNATARAKLPPAAQPIWITSLEESPNGARFLFLLDGRTADAPNPHPAPHPAPHPDWARIFDLFDGQNPASVAAARIRWTAAKAAGHALTYWKQTDGGWSKT